MKHGAGNGSPDALRREYESLRYEGDLAQDTGLAPGRRVKARLWVGVALGAGAGLAAALVLAGMVIAAAPRSSEGRQATLRLEPPTVSLSMPALPPMSELTLDLSSALPRGATLSPPAVSGPSRSLAHADPS